jgi:hypothetical protein
LSCNASKLYYWQAESIAESRGLLSQKHHLLPNDGNPDIVEALGAVSALDYKSFSAGSFYHEIPRSLDVFSLNKRRQGAQRLADALEGNWVRILDFLACDAMRP